MKIPLLIAGSLLALVACKSDETARASAEKPTALPGGGCTAASAPVCCQTHPISGAMSGTCVANQNACTAAGGLVTQEPVAGCG